ncbi:MAG: WYL domain-containing protein [Actinomycetota bacterium]|nr:WYL domain-containing protein [Actinomycetota bacterium]
MNRTDRLYAIAEELRAAGPGGRTSAWLARRFEVTGRTIKRDVTALQEAGVPIYGIGGHGGGYRLDEAATLPPVAFTAGEAIAIAAALALDANAPFAADGRSALTKVMDAMGPAGRADARSLAAKVWTRNPPTGAAARARRVVEEALRRQVVVVLDYRDRSGAHTRRRPVEPQVFANTGGHWYLLAWCRWRRAGRWFRLDRIEGATLTTEPAPVRDLTEVFGAIPTDAAHVGI